MTTSSGASSATASVWRCWAASKAAVSDGSGTALSSAGVTERYAGPVTRSPRARERR